ncbi:MAG: selenium metabolism-associated LysR family transcriptional regulator [bacterium]|nr:selenium metabolism-associated LysR family transcriptional regulator [bacterium]
MDDHRLKVFCSVAKSLSFSKAAKENYITQSAVSRIVKNLEEELGVQLINRQRAAVSLTSVGKHFYQRAQNIIEMYAKTVKEVDELINTVKGVLSVGTSTTVSRYVFPDILFAFKKSYPMIEVTHRVNNTSQILESLIAGDIEIGLVEDRVYYPGVISEKLCEDELVLVVGRKHAWAKKGRLAVEEFIKEPFFRREKGSGTRRMMEQRLKEMGIKPIDLNAAVTSASTDLIIRAVEQGLGTACVSKWAVREKIRQGTLKTVELFEQPLSRDFLIIRLDQKLHTHVAQTFLNFLHQCPPPKAP